jgi:3-oxoacyl-[acyl-carrier-protein] synthase III
MPPIWTPSVVHGDTDMLFPFDRVPGTNQIGATRAWGFDLVAACSGFLYGLTRRRTLWLRERTIKCW